MRTYILILTLIFIVTIIFIMVYPAKIPTDFQMIEPGLNKKEITIGLISDTHIPTRASEIPEKVFQILKDVDFIIHSGDFVDLSVKQKLEKIAPVYAVQGNMDFDEIRQEFPRMIILRIFDHRIGVYHGSFIPWELTRIAKKYDLDVLVSGHTHISSIKKNSIIYINPGSPTNPLFSKKSIGLLKITIDSIEPEIVHV